MDPRAIVDLHPEDQVEVETGEEEKNIDADIDITQDLLRVAGPAGQGQETEDTEETVTQGAEVEIKIVEGKRIRIKQQLVRERKYQNWINIQLKSIEENKVLHQLIQSQR